MGLTTQEQILIEQRVANEGKSTGLAYLFWALFGGLGIHRFYLDRTRSGIAMIALFIVGVATTPIFIGSLLLAGLVVWMLVDAFLIPGMVRQQREDTRRRLSADAALADIAGIPVDTSKWSKEDRERFISQRVSR